ncbi:MAG: NAD(P)-binding protein [Cyclobacteriaceae bacterium]
MRIEVVIIGSGISATSQARLLKERGVDALLLEKSAQPGGLVSCVEIDGRLYHKVGGHVFNSKNPEVLDWFWKHFNRDREFVHAQRNAKVLLEGQYIGYPIENHLFQLPNHIVKRVINEWFGSGYSDSSDGSDFQTFLVNRFGPTLYKLYFGPYNQKIWQTDLSEVSLDWLDGKLPMPDLEDAIVQNILKKEESEMVHSSFYYPRQGGSQFIIDRLGEGLDINTNYEVRKIQKTAEGWLINDELTCQKVVYTGDIRRLSSMLHGVGEDVLEACKAVENLQSNGTSNVLCETDPSDLSWLYLPDPATRAHRIIYTGSFSVHNNASNGRLTCTVEFSGQVSEAEMTAEVAKLPGNLQVLASNYEPNSYVIQMHDTRARVDRVRQLLQPEGFFLLGRFAEWEYYNMDKCIERAMILTDQIIDGR